MDFVFRARSQVKENEGQGVAPDPARPDPGVGTPNYRQRGGLAFSTQENPFTLR